MKKRLGAYTTNTVSVVLLFVVLSLLLKTGVISSYIGGLMINACIAIIMATSLNLTSGCLGELVLGHAGFMSIGAYTSALLTMHMNLPKGIEFPFALIIGGLFAAFCGLLIGIPALRLKGDYLAIITLGFGEIIRIVILAFNFTGGGRGLSGIPNYTSFTWVFWVTVATITILFTFMFSRHGRAILSIRENEIAAEAVGINTIYYKILTFTISSFFAGIAGGLYAHYITVIDPSNFSFMRSTEFLVMVVLGGMGSFTGSTLAAIGLTFLPELLRGGFDKYRLLIYSLILIVVMIFKPSGLFGKKEFYLHRTILKLRDRFILRKSPVEAKRGGRSL